MPEVPAPVRKERAARLRRAGAAALKRFLESRVGATAEVLVEAGSKGRAPDYAPVRLAFEAPEGAIVPARFARLSGFALVGEPAA
jgi:threonylcarbamoyladenosine tRNA methylthiotransferase MtaB